MTVAAVTCKEGTAQILRLLEDLWLCERGCGELGLEAIVEAKDSSTVEAMDVFLPHRVTEVTDQSSLYLDAKFTDGYVLCWPDTYRGGIQVVKRRKQQERGTVRIEEWEASVGTVSSEIVYNRPECSQIHLEFDPPIGEGDQEFRIFRLGIVFDRLASVASLLGCKRHTVNLFTYGLLPFAGAPLGSLLQERRIDPHHVLCIKKHCIQLKLFGVPEITRVSPDPMVSFSFPPCDMPTRYCPPLERIAQRQQTTVDALKALPSYYMGWEFREVDGNDGQCIAIDCFPSVIWKWLYDNWLVVLAILISLAALGVALSVKG